MDNLESSLDKLEKARQDARDNPRKKLSSKYKHFTTRVTQAEREMQRINRINRNAPVIRTKIPESE